MSQTADSQPTQTLHVESEQTMSAQLQRLGQCVPAYKSHIQHVTFLPVIVEMCCIGMPVLTDFTCWIVCIT